MTHSDQLDSPAEHPWIERFLAHPDQELADFLAGYARIEPYERAELPDAARLLFRHNAHALTVLDGAVGRFLRQERLAGVPAAGPAVLNRKLLQIMDALRLVSLLQLKRTALVLRKEFSLWRSWVERLPGGANVDVRAEYLSTLALTQRLLQDVTDLHRTALEPYWIAVCEQAGGMLPQTYLQIGLLGLRLLPERSGAPNERPWMTGLARWATLRRPPLKVFTQQWLMLKRLYPRPPAHWRVAVAGTLKQRFLRSMPGSIEEYWRGDVGLDRVGAEERAPKKTTILPPPKDQIDAVLARSHEPVKKITMEANRFISQVERFAEVTGESHYLVRSACNLGMRLLKSGPQEEHGERGKFAVKLARKALNWQPDDVFVWALWRDGLEAEGRFQAAEFVGWEAVRRFPEDPQRRNQLALLLSKLPNRADDAKRLLRETLQRFPNNTVAAHQLAILLARRAESLNEAEALLQKLLQDEPDNQATRARLERFVSIRAQGADGDPSFADTETRPEPSAEPEVEEDLQEDETDSLFTTVIRGGRLRRMAAYMSWNCISEDRALEEVRDILATDPNSSYARYLHEQLTGQASSEEAIDVGVGDFGVAFIDALRTKDPKRLARLEEQYPDPTQLYDLARVILFADVEAAKQTVDWLSRRSVGESRPIVALRGFLQQRLDGAIEDAEEGIIVSDLDGFLVLVAANDNIRLDLMEAALAPWDLALAA